jgi:hypothetical protein
MTPGEAKTIIAAYLTGQSVGHLELQAACDVAGKESEYASFLAEEFGLNQNWVSDCALFLAQAAEFCALTNEQRASERPEVMMHVEDCPSCREVFWTIAPLWTNYTTADRDSGITTLVRRLAEQIRLIVAATGQLRESGFGPPANAGKPVAALAGSALELTADSTTRKEWTLTDDEAGCILRLSVAAGTPGRSGLSCMIECDDPIIIEQARIEVHETTSRTLQLAGRLVDFQAAPFYLEPGSWTITVRSPAPEGPQSWEIPLRIDTEPVDTGEESHDE